MKVQSISAGIQSGLWSCYTVPEIERSVGRKLQRIILKRCNMYELTLDKISKSYNQIKGCAFKSLGVSDFDAYISYADIAANIASQFNWIYVDDDFEESFSLIAQQIVDENQNTYAPHGKRIVFYDEIGSVACLSIQYLRALIQLEYEILYIFESSTRKLANTIEKELECYDKCEVININSSGFHRIDKIRQLYKRIIEFSPDVALLETPAEGAFGAILWSALPQVRRFRIVPGDHHFYFGKSCSDHFLEFREFGRTVAVEKRGIKKEQILAQPYYPLTDNSVFDGFPASIDRTESIIIFSASSPYKTYGEDSSYFKVLRHILNTYQQVIVLFAGGGYLDPFHDFIEENGFQDRLYLLGYRNDLNMCIAKCDIYLCSYPMTGGLTTQLAAYYAKPILSYTSDDLPGNKVEDIVEGIKVDHAKITYTEIQEFYQYMDKLIRDEEYRVSEGLARREGLITPDLFCRMLCENIAKPRPASGNTMRIDYNRIVSINLERDNEYMPGYLSFMMKNFSYKILWNFPYLIPCMLFSKSMLKRAIRAVCK